LQDKCSGLKSLYYKLWYYIRKMKNRDMSKNLLNHKSRTKVFVISSVFVLPGLITPLQDLLKWDFKLWCQPLNLFKKEIDSKYTDYLCILFGSRQCIRNLFLSYIWKIEADEDIWLELLKKLAHILCHLNDQVPGIGLVWLC
jgi:hypothetical protein